MTSGFGVGVCKFVLGLKNCCRIAPKTVPVWTSQRMASFCYLSYASSLPRVKEAKKHMYVLPCVDETHAGQVIRVDQVVVELPQLTGFKLPFIDQSSEIQIF